MKLDAFATLAAVIRNGTLSAAAAEMHLTPSAVSMQMKQLEVFFGQPLFDRSGSQMRPMPLANEASHIMTEALRKLEGLRDVSHIAVRGVVTVGVLESMLPLLLPQTLAFAREHHPGLDVRVSTGRSIALAAAVKAGELDAALIARPEDGGSSRLHWRPVEERALVLVLPPNAAALSLAEAFATYEWIRYDCGTTVGGLAKHFLLTRQIPTRGHREFDSAAAILAMVSAGLGASVLEISDPNLLGAYPVRVVDLGNDAPSYQLSLVVRRTDEENRKLAALGESLRFALQNARDRRHAATRSDSPARMPARA